MPMLYRKLRRDLWHLRGQVIAIIMVVASGVAVVVTSRTSYESLSSSQQSYYAAYRFADVFVQLKRAPNLIARKIAALPGVTAVSARIVFDVTLDVPDLPEPATGRLISVPERQTPMINDLHLRSGRYVAPGRRDEVMISEAFAKANQLQPGSSFGAILNGRWAQLQVVGIALSPEFVYEVRGTDLFPDNRRFGVMWMSHDAMEAAFDMEGAFNDLALTRTADANEAAIIDRVDALLERYGGLGAYGREDQVSNRFLSDEIKQNRVFGTVLPAIFLGVAAFLLNIVLSRLVAMQRDQIGVLKAFGYTHIAVSVHYLLFAVVAVAIGAVSGTALGIWLGSLINRLYVELYRFPAFTYQASPVVITIAIAASGAAALVGALAAVRRAWGVPPAEAMRPEPPARFSAGILERWGLQRWTSPVSRMIVRNILRRPARAALSILGVAFAMAILVLGRYFVDAIQYLAMVQFRMVQRENMTVVAHNPLPARARYDLSRLPAIVRSEPFRVVPVRLRSGHRSRRVALMGLQSGTGLRRLLDQRLHPVPLSSDGVMLTDKLAEILDVTAGDAVTVEVLEGSRPRRRILVSGTVDEMLGLNAYMQLSTLNAFLREDASVSGSFLRVDGAELTTLYQLLKRMPAIGGVLRKDATLQSFEQTLAQSMNIFTSILVGFACVIAVAVVYNAARIALSERGRELASLRVLGFTRKETTLMLLGEQAILLAVALPLGAAMGYGISASLASAYQWELFRMPLVVAPKTYVFALVVICLAAGFSALLVRRRLDQLDLVEVLKTRE